MIQWWKILGVLLVLYALVGGLLLPVPNLAILEQSIRNLYYHVPMWFGMIALLSASTIKAIQTLGHKQNEISGSDGVLNKRTLFDLQSENFARVGMAFGIAGLCTGMIWARHTWGDYWPNDPKLNSAAIGMLMYAAYFVLRRSIEDEEKRARVSAVYNIFCFPVYLTLIFILPRLTDSLHPGNGGNPGFNSYDLDSRLRMVFYPAVIGWTLLGFWIADLSIRLKKLEIK